MLKRSVIAATLAFWPTTTAHACWFRPGCLRDFLPAAGETLPANFASVALQQCVGAKDITISAERDGRVRSLDFDREEATTERTVLGHTDTTSLYFDILRVRSPLMAGDTLVVRYAADHDDDAGVQNVEARWPIVEDAVLPDGLGALQVTKSRGPVEVSADTSCSRTMVSSYADVSLRNSPIEAWVPRLRYELRIDDAPWIYFDSLAAAYDTGSWRSSLGRGRDRVVVGCEVEPHRPKINDVYVMTKPLDPGPHRVRMLGFLASGEQLSSEEVTIDLQCDPDSARSLRAALDACMDTKTGSTSNAVAANSGEVASCSAVAPGRSHGALALVWLGLLLTLRRRR